MNKKIILHAGLHKTASTSIQEALKSAHDELAKKRIAYPLLDINGNVASNHSFMMYSLFCNEPEKYHINQKWGYNTADKVKQLNDYYEQYLTNIINDKANDVVLISAEDLFSLDKSSLIKLKSFLEEKFNVSIEIVFYVRHLCDYLQSVIQQRVKDGGWKELLLSEIRHGHLGRVSDKISQFDDVFGKDSVKAYKYEDAIKYPGGIINHFLNNILGVDDVRFDDVKYNNSLSFESFAIHSKVNKKFPLYKDGVLSSERKHDDLHLVVNLPGVKFCLEQSFFDRCYTDLFEEFKFLNQRFDIEYAPKVCAGINKQETWSESTLSYLDMIIPGLSSLVQKEIIDLLRDQCVIYKDNDAEKAFNLISLAFKYRSSGPKIKSIYDEIFAKLNNNVVGEAVHHG
ncbi:hypothetical protein [Vibrio parahaemolyticus]